jgi:hypothetical protein
MKKRTVGLSFLIVICELAIYTRTTSLSSDESFYYQLAARYSARVSFMLLVGILCWTGIKGLKFIYEKESRRKLFVTLLLVLALNHLIHFYFLAMNFNAKSLELREFKTCPEQWLILS